ncbi:MAG: GNAT family N-acetyltransferase [Candidatus Diapherotrites archaeon]|jgi:ribosomal protein S18 acetylase RimI-like enzyme|nr:GNAT family N-acetyltransferase [Candidatus Diapherotrites archaeon]MBT4596640.1 GNAT family N-acetyltransferase [Candidatus Diapherotrites archaeon]
MNNYESINDYEIIKPILEEQIKDDALKSRLLSLGISLEQLIEKEINNLKANNTKIISNENNLGFISFIEKPWESGIFDKKMASIQAIGYKTFDEELVGKLFEFVFEQIKEKSIEHLSMRINPKIAEEINFFLEENDFHLIERYVTFINDLENVSENELDLNDIKIYDSDEKVIGLICEIAKSSFTLDRFHADQKIDNSKASISRSEWIKNLANGRGKVIYGLSSDEVTSFLGFREIVSSYSVKYGVIELIAVEAKFRGKGFGTKMINKFLLESKKSGCKFSIVGTQEKNEASIKLYEKNNFSQLKTNLTFHWSKD